MKRTVVTVVCAFGTFDILHPGHIAYLAEARRKGGSLTVIVTRDKAVFRRKGIRPTFSERVRSMMVAQLKMVDRVLLGDRDDSWRILEKVRPARICLGYDQKEALRSMCASRAYQALDAPVITIARAVRPALYHSSILRFKNDNRLV